jgi:hypothetical protein
MPCTQNIDTISPRRSVIIICLFIRSVSYGTSQPHALSIVSLWQLFRENGRTLFTHRVLNAKRTTPAAVEHVLITASFCYRNIFVATTMQDDGEFEESMHKVNLIGQPQTTKYTLCRYITAKDINIINLYI